MPCPPACWRRFPRRGTPTRNWPAGPTSARFISFADQPDDDRLSYLELAARITHAARLTDRIAVSAPHRRWSVPWTHWPPEHPHRILDGHLGPINGVICADPGDGNPVAASIGQDAKLRIWDVVTAEPRGTYTVGSAPLVAVSAARLPEQRTVIVLLSADGMLHTWDMSTAALLRTIPVASLWRRLAWLRNADLTLRCLGTPDGRQFAITGGRGIRTSIWDLSSGRRCSPFFRAARLQQRSSSPSLSTDGLSLAPRWAAPNDGCAISRPARNCLTSAGGFDLPGCDHSTTALFADRP